MSFFETQCRVAWSPWSLCLSVCLSVCHDRELCKNSCTDRDVVWGMDSSGSTEALLDGVHIGATWRIQLNRPYAAAMRHFCPITYLDIKFRPTRLLRSVNFHIFASGSKCAYATKPARTRRTNFTKYAVFVCVVRYTALISFNNKMIRTSYYIRNHFIRNMGILWNRN